MILGIKTKKELFLRHLMMALTGVILISIFMLSRLDVPFANRFYKALGDTAFCLLFFALAIGPLVKLWNPFGKFLSWRREVGIWFAVFAFSHFIFLIQGAWGIPGLELPIYLGLVGLFWAIILALTSSDWAVNFLGPSAWKWLHSMVYVIFYVVAGHGFYFLFWSYPHYDWFQYPFLIMFITIPTLQISALVKQVRKERKNRVEIKNTKLQLPLVGRKIVAKGTTEISFDISKINFPFIAGQYVHLVLAKNLYENGTGSARDLSIVSSPNDKKVLSLAFRNSDSGFKKTLLELPFGSLVTIEGPYGHFTLPEKISEPIVFVVGGIGITPIMSMLRFAREKKIQAEMTLLYANSSKESATYFDELEALSKTNTNFVIKNKFGRIDAEFIEQSVTGEKNKKLWYIVGPVGMVSSTLAILSKLGVPDDKIYFEEFTGY